MTQFSSKPPFFNNFEEALKEILIVIEAKDFDLQKLKETSSIISLAWATAEQIGREKGMREAINKVADYDLDQQEHNAAEWCEGFNDCQKQTLSNLERLLTKPE